MAAATPAKPKGRALLFGLNYDKIDYARLQGCVNDVVNMGEFLKNTMGIPVEVYTDVTTPSATTYTGIMKKIYELALKSYKEKLEFVYIHYSGHGTHMKDENNDEEDGEDEALVPSNFDKAGVLQDDFFHSVFEHFNPKTKVVCVFDCCHSGTIGDLKFSWEMPSRKCRTENKTCTVKAQVLALSGCLDSQTSADAYNILQDGKYSGALTSCILLALTENPSLGDDIFAFQAAVEAKLKERRFSQVPVITSTYNLLKSPRVLSLRK